MRRIRRLLFQALACAVLGPAMLCAAPNGEQWAIIQRDIGALTVQTPGLHHYGTDWERAAIAFDHRWLRLRHGDGEAWDAWRGGGVRRLHSVAVDSWWTVANRVRIDGSFRHEPLMNIALPAVGLSLQLLPGSARRSAVFVSAHLPWISTPQFETLAPSLSIEWSNELFRTRATERTRPFIAYVGIRIDQGIRWTWFADSTVPAQKGKLLDAVLRGTLRWRFGPVSLVTAFGGQQKRAFTVDSSLIWHFDRRGTSPASNVQPLRDPDSVSGDSPRR